MDIRLAEKADVMDVVTILNSVTEKLLNKGVQQWEYPWNVEEIEQEIIDGNLFVVELDEKVIGTFSIKKIQQLNSLPIAEDNLYLYRIAISSEKQGKNYGLKVVDFALNYGKSKDKTIYLDCWAGNNKLKDFYSSSGMMYLGDYPEENYEISIFKG